MSEATLKYKGQVTVPKDVRGSLEVEAGDKLLFVVDGNKAVVYSVRTGSLRGSRGVFKVRARHKGKAAERGAARRAVVKHVMKASEIEDDPPA